MTLEAPRHSQGLCAHRKADGMGGFPSIGKQLKLP